MDSKHRFEYRFASLNDLDDLVSINIDDELEHQEIDQALFTRLIVQKEVLVALSENKIIGLIYWLDDFLGRTNQWYLEQITVAKPFRKNGVGLGLMKHFLEYAKSQKIEKVFADVHNDNYPSLGMSLKSGGLISGFIEGVGSTKEKDERVIFRWELNSSE